MKRRLATKKILIASVGVGAVSYVVACDTSYTSGNLVPPLATDSGATDSGQDVATSGNLMAPDTGAADTSVVDTGADVATSGMDAGPDAEDAGGGDANDGGG